MKNKGIVLSIVFAIGIAAVLLLAKTGEPPQKHAAAGLDAPAFELKDTEGKVWKLSDLKGKLVLLNFWASWCDSCKEENPSIQNLINAEKGNDEFVFISVLFKDDPAKAMEYMRTNGFNFHVLIDDKNIAREYRVSGVPETFIIDAKGIVRQNIRGPVQWDSPDIKAAINKLIASGS